MSYIEQLKQSIIKNGISENDTITKELETPEFLIEVVKKHGEALHLVPKEMRTPEMCWLAVKNNGLALKDVPEEMKTPEMYAEAVKSNGKALRNVPEDMKTPEMCREAVKNDIEAFGYVPEDMKTKKICLETFKNNRGAFIYVPKKVETLEFYLEAVKNYGVSLGNVPKKMRTPEMCWIAIKNDGKDLYYVPKDMKTPEMCREAVKNNGEAIYHVPREMRTLEMCWLAVKNNGIALYSVPEEMRTPEMCLEAVKNNGLALNYVPEEMKTPEICAEAVENNGLALKYVPEEMKILEICAKAVENNGLALEYVPEEMKTLEICAEAVENNGLALEDVPKGMKMPKMCLEAVKNNGLALKYVPIEMLTPELCMEAIKNNGLALKYVPKEKITLEMCIESCSNSGLYLKELYDLAKKADKFNDVCHFVPNLHVLNKYPEEQIEKFNKKIWFGLARNDLFNTNIDTKFALVEAILSFGAFEKDSTQLERIGLLQRMATYIPKEENLFVANLDEFAKENFEVVKKITETTYYLDRDRLLSDTNIIKLFGSKYQAKRAIEDLPYRYSDEKMKQVINSLETDEQIDDDYKKVMTYIFKNGYDKYEKQKGYLVKLAKDIQQEKIRDKKAGNILEYKIRKFYYEHDSKLIMSPQKLHRIFDGMDMEYKPGFYEFFKDNYEQILEDETKQSELSKIQKQWDKIVEANLGQKINFDKCKLYIYSHKYENVAEDELEIAKLSSNCGYSQEDFEKVQAIFRAQKERTKSSIPQIEKKDEKTGYTYKVLRLDDPTAIFVGELTDCCQALGDAGESCMKHSVTSTNGRVLVVQDENGKILSQSWIWRNKNTLCFDNIEAVAKDSNNKKIISSNLLSVIKGAAKDFVETDKIEMQKWQEAKLKELEEERKSGKIDEQKYSQEKDRVRRTVEGQQLTKVTVGIGYTDVDLSGLKTDNENKYPEEHVDYIHDSRTQLILYEDTSIAHKENEDKTVAIYSDNENSNKLIDVDTSEINADDEIDDDWEYNDDERENDYNEEWQDCAIDIEDIKTAIKYAQDREEARAALKNIEKWLEENSIEI